MRCEFQERETCDRLLATCFVGDRNINREIALAGQAVAFVNYDDTYLQEEQAAKRNLGGRAYPPGGT
jgi:endonuclease YncB( thermonuclease family)